MANKQRFMSKFISFLVDVVVPRPELKKLDRKNRE